MKQRGRGYLTRPDLSAAWAAAGVVGVPLKTGVEFGQPADAKELENIARIVTVAPLLP